MGLMKMKDDDEGPNPYRYPDRSFGTKATICHQPRLGVFTNLFLFFFFSLLRIALFIFIIGIILLLIRLEKEKERK